MNRIWKTFTTLRACGCFYMLSGSAVVCTPRRGSVCPQDSETGCDNWVLLTVCTGTVSPPGAQQDGVEGREKKQTGVQSVKLMSLLCAGRRQLLSEYTVLQGSPPQTPIPPSLSSQARLCLWSISQVLVVLSRSAIADCEGQIITPTTPTPTHNPQITNYLNNLGV